MNHRRGSPLKWAPMAVTRLVHELMYAALSQLG